MKFYVGQRVRVVRRDPEVSKTGKTNMPRHSSVKLGAEATVKGTLSHPNEGFASELGDVSILIDGYPYGCGMVNSWQLEPLYDGNQVVSWESMRELWMPNRETV